MPRGLGLTDAMDRLMRGFTGGADAASQGLQGAVGMLAQQKLAQDQMKFDTEQAQAKMAADQAALKEKRAWDEQMARRREDFDAADKGLRRRIVTEPNQQEFEHASSDVSARIKDNPVTNLFDSGLTGLIPAGVMTALEGGSVMNDPNNQSRLMTQREDGWERDPTWVDPRAKPPAPPPTALDPKRSQWFSGEARQRALKSPRLDTTTRFLLALDDPMTPPDEKASIAQKLEALDDRTLAQAQASYQATITEETIRLMEEQVAAGAADSPFLEKAIAGLKAKYGPQPWNPGEGEIPPEQPWSPPMAAGDEPGDVGDIDLDDPNVPDEVKEDALRASLPAVAPSTPAAPPAPQSQWLPGGNAQLPGGETWRPPSRSMGRPPQPNAVDLAVDRDVMEAEQQGLTIDDLLAQEDPTWPAEVERMEAEANADQPPPGPPRAGGGPVDELVDPFAAPPGGSPPTATEQVGLGDLTRFLGQFADQGGQAFTDLLTGGAQSQAWAGAPAGTPVQPTVGLEGGGMSAELPLVNVAPGIDLAEPAAASYHDLMNDPNMTPELQQILLRPSQGQVSAFRTYETQQGMRDRWQAGERPAGWVAPPAVPGPEAGKHTSGTALDLGHVPPDLAELLMRHGWRPTPGDYTHWRFLGGQ